MRQHTGDPVSTHGSPETAENEERIRLAQTGDAEAFEWLYERHCESLRRYVLAIVRDPDQADDVLADTFLLAWRDLPKLRDCRRFDAWLLRIARHRALSAVSRRRYTLGAEAIAGIADDRRYGRPDRELEAAQARESLSAALATLPEAQRRAVTLRYLEGLPGAEISRRLGKRDQAVWALTYRALKGLRRALEMPV